MENLNAEQVKKWLQICADDTPYPDQGRALLDALALINSQEQRIKELTEANEHLRERLLESEERRESEKKSAHTGLSIYLLKSEALAAENEKLQACSEGLKKFCNIFKTCYKIKRKRVDTVKSDTVRKMHSEIKRRCIEGGIYPAFVARVIDEVVKEILKGEDINARIYR